MKKQFSFLISLAGAIIFFASCQKKLDLPADSEVAGTPLPGQTTYCRIESIWENPNTPGQRFILILYDEYENPVAVTTPVPSTGHPYKTFKYDSWHRLKEYRGDYANQFFEFWHVYGYDQQGRIAWDTLYTLGLKGETPSGYLGKNISEIQYDAQNRISKVITTQWLPPSSTPTVSTYEYDGAGNRLYPPAFGITYDNKQHLYRTNDIWQFLNRDYSMNNPFIADEYNSTGFPTKINSSRSYNFLNEINLQNSQIGYSCRPAYW
ncbi:MAG TPA: hypothetical protein VJT83_00925 [Chitinophagaceae bacterium]|nr:hypothetical protein [Chitinophagaceae bacterium]